jgi:hypothetical protein
LYPMTRLSKVLGGWRPANDQLRKEKTLCIITQLSLDILPGVVLL